MIRLSTLLLAACAVPSDPLNPAPLDPEDTAAPGETDSGSTSGGADCAITVATICADCDVTIDWSAVATDWDGDPFDPAHTSALALAVFDEPPATGDLAATLCAGTAIADFVGGLAVVHDFYAVQAVLGTDLPRVVLEDHLGVFEAMALDDGTSTLAVLVPDTASTNDFVEMK